MTKTAKDYGKKELRYRQAPMPKGLCKCDVVVDVGAGLRPIVWYKPKLHICIEPYEPYCEVLREAGFEVWCKTVQSLMRTWTLKVDAVYLLDVIEHLAKRTGQDVLAWAQKVARCQVVVYTPYGFVEQTEDAWGLGGHHWQTHRSGWVPEEFPGWRIQYLNPHRKPPQGFYAVWNKDSGADLA